MEMMPTSDANRKYGLWRTVAKILFPLALLIGLFFINQKVMTSKQEKEKTVSPTSISSNNDYIKRAREDIQFLSALHQATLIIHSTTTAMEE